MINDFLDHKTKAPHKIVKPCHLVPPSGHTTTKIVSEVTNTILSSPGITSQIIDEEFLFDSKNVFEISGSTDIRLIDCNIVNLNGIKEIRASGTAILSTTESIEFNLFISMIYGSCKLTDEIDLFGKSCLSYPLTLKLKNTNGRVCNSAFKINVFSISPAKHQKIGQLLGFLMFNKNENLI